MKLKEIPSNTVVHTPTEEEAKELLSILHENGYKWYVGTALCKTLKWNVNGDKTCYKIYVSDKSVSYSDTDWFKGHNKTILTLAEFRERYCEEEKPQPKFKVDDCVSIRWINKWGKIIGLRFHKEAQEWEYYIKVYPKGRATAFESKLSPYPETKPTEMETKEEKSENPINLCELLNGHVGETFYSLAYGEVVLDKIRCGTQEGNSPDFLCIRATSFDSGDIIVNPNGKLRNAGVVDLVPSRELWEQYPLDPYTAWMKWKEKQTQYKIHLMLDAKPECPFSSEVGSCEFAFRTPADRDKCIEEIKAIIEKYSK